jgi:hypothetical protein
MAVSSAQGFSPNHFPMFNENAPIDRSTARQIGQIAREFQALGDYFTTLGRATERLEHAMRHSHCPCERPMPSDGCHPQGGLTTVVDG